MEVNCKINTKANPILATKYVFKAFGNSEKTEDKQAYVMVNHLTQRTLNNYIDHARGKLANPCDVFLGQVEKVVGVYNSIVKRDMTKEEIVEAEANTMLNTLIMEVYRYLISEMSLNEEETKN